MRSLVLRSLARISRQQFCEGNHAPASFTGSLHGNFHGVSNPTAAGSQNYGCREYSSGSTPIQIVSPDNIVRSPLPDVELPERTVHEEIFRSCDLNKDLIAVEEFLTGKSITYGELKERAIRVASALSGLGYSKGDVVLCYSINNIETAILTLACSCLGVWFSPANGTFTPDELAKQIEDSAAKAVFTADILAPVATAALADTAKTGCVKDRFVFGESPGFRPFSSLISEGSGSLPDVTFNLKNDVFALPYSSGTTGLPKGVMLTHSNIVSNICQIDAAEHIGRGDPTLGLLPFSHIYGMTVVLFGTLSQGAKLVTLPKFDPEAFLKCLQMKQIRIAPLVPPLILFLAKHPVVSKFDLTSIQSVFSAAACLGAELTDEFLHRHNHGCRVLQGYGLTETSPAINTDTVGISGSVGCLVPNTIGKILDVETGLPLGPGQEGEYCMKGPQIMKGYHKNEEATRGMIDEDGWLHTGDIGHFTEKGVLYISERLKELIKYKGHQVSPAELENLLLTHPGVADAAVIGVPDPVAEELPRAYVVRQPGQQVEEKEIVDFVEGKVSPAKRLRGGVEFVNEIPKNPSGKILRRVLRAQLSK